MPGTAGAPGVFVTGTDTGVGKTLVAAALVRGFVANGCRVAVMKPVASGSNRTDEGLRSVDALTLIQAANTQAGYEQVNPYCFEPPISPHIAAEEAGIYIDLGLIRRAFEELRMSSDLVVVEGAGGWLAPVRMPLTMADLAIRLEIPVLMVVGMRLGCLNHAQLTKLAIETRGVTFAGWVANGLDPAIERWSENLQALQQLLGCPPLAVVPYLGRSGDPSGHASAPGAMPVDANVPPMRSAAARLLEALRPGRS